MRGWIVVMAALTLVGCKKKDAAADSADSGYVDYSQLECDPVGANPEMGALLNADLDSDVEIIVKDPQHPGDPGPLNLP